MVSHGLSEYFTDHIREMLDKSIQGPVVPYFFALPCWEAGPVGGWDGIVLMLGTVGAQVTGILEGMYRG